MARLTLTNNPGVHSLILEREVAAGYADYDVASRDGLWLAAHRKLRCPIQNCRCFADGDFVASAGTLIYKTGIGESALLQLYGDFTGDVDAVRQEALGSYMVALKKGSRTVVFTDEYETFQVYYYLRDRTWVVGNSLAAVAIGARTIQTLEVNALALLEKAFTNAIIGNETVFQHVYKLLGSECLEIDSQNESAIVSRLPRARSGGLHEGWSVDELAEEFAGTLRSIAEVFARVFADIRIMSTGGIDNRMLLAALLANGARPGLLFGVGDSVLTNTRDEDLQVNRAYAKAFGLRLHLMDWGTDKRDITRDWCVLFAKYGFYMSIYPGSVGLFRGLVSGVPGTPDCILDGYFGETIRNRPWMESLGGESTIRWSTLLLNAWFGGRKHDMKCALGPWFHELLAHMGAELARRTEEMGIERCDGGYNLGDLHKVYGLWFRDAHASLTNLTNLALPSCSPLGEPALQRNALSVPLAHRTRDRFALKVIEKLDKRLLGIPFFSHGSMMALDRRKLELHPQSASVVHARISEIVRGLGVRGQAYQAVRRAYWTAKKCSGQRPGVAKSRQEQLEAQFLLRQVEDIIRREQGRAGLNLVNPRGYIGNPSHLAHYASFLWCINRVMALPGSKVRSGV